MKLERKIKLTPAYDKRHFDPKKNYGIGCVDMRFLVKGPEGVIQFAFMTGWFLPQNKNISTDMYPYAYDLGYHSYVPLYEGQPKMTDECPYLDGKPCYYDGTSLGAEGVLELLIKDGVEAVWEFLERDYKVKFEGVQK